MISCTQKYANYQVIRKADFQYPAPAHQEPITQKMHPGKKDRMEKCFNQWLFSSNAEKEKEEHLPVMVRYLCPKDNYLIETRMTHTWWTALVFSRACIDIKTHCPKGNR